MVRQAEKHPRRVVATLILLLTCACDFLIDGKPPEAKVKGAKIALSETSNRNDVYKALFRGQVADVRFLVNSTDGRKNRLKQSLGFSSCFDLAALAYEEQWTSAIRVELEDHVVPICRIIGHLGKGAAFAGTGNFLAARSEIKALNALKKIIKTSPEKEYLSYSSYYLIGFLRFQQKKYSDTIRILKRAHNIEKKFSMNNPFSWAFSSLYYIGRGYEASGRPHNALKSYHRLLKRWPDMVTAKKRVQEIEEMLTSSRH